MELSAIEVWQIPAQWSIARQWLLIIVMSGGVLISGCTFWLHPAWQHYQQLLIETEELLQHSSLTSTPALSLQHQPPPPPLPATLTSAHQSMHATLPTLLQQISQLTEQQNLSLILLQQQPALLQHDHPQNNQPQDARLSQALLLEITGAYAAISTFVATLGSTSQRLAIEEMILGREQPAEYPLKLRLSLLFYPLPPLTP